MQTKIYNYFRKCLFLCAMFVQFISYGQNVTINTSINGFRHDWDCCNDGAAVGCVYSNYPDPRYKVWIGYNGGSFQQYTNGTGLYCGTPDYTYGADNVSCNLWNPGVITGPTLTGNATSLSVDMQSWESDGCGSACSPQDNHGCPFDACCYNADDVRCGRLRIGDIDFSLYAPCNTQTYNGAFESGTFLSMHDRCSDRNGAGYGINQLNVTWNFADAPTVTKQPSDVSYGGSVRDVCAGMSQTLTVICNTFGSASPQWTLGRWVKWQSSPDGSTWNDISGTLNLSANLTQNTFNYNFTPVTAGTVYYRAVLSSLCNSGFGSQTTNSNPVQFNVHGGADPFCTAPQCNIIYVDPVNGNDFTGDGKPVTPFKTISKAATAGTGYTYIRVAQGTGTDANIVYLSSGLIIEGGYVRSGGSGELWAKSSSSTNKTSITFSGTENPAGVYHVVAFKSDNKNNWTVKDLDITTANTPAGIYDGSNRGMSNYGFLIINNSSNYNIVRCNLNIGNAGAGMPGPYNGSPGGGASGGGGGGGSAGNSGTCNTSNGVSAGGSGVGGTGANATINTTNTGEQGTAGSGGAGYGTDDGGCAISCANTSGNDGIAGGTGGTGGSWTAGTRPASPALVSAAYFTPAGQASVGGNGGGGGGGGGGSGSRGGKVACINCDGFTGSSGQTGASGGGGGVGGYGGGGAFGIWQYSSSSGANVQEVYVNSLGAVGTGGSGAAGRPGNGAVTRIEGTCNSCVNKRCAGAGGAGGAGGTGGRGQDGANGIAYNYVVDGVSTATAASAPIYFSTVTLDNYSQRSNVSGKMCNNSEIDMTKTSGTWTLPAGLSYVQDLTSSTSSYNSGSNPVKVTTSSYNAFFDVNNGTLLTKFLYVATDNRNIPTIVKSSTFLCKGSTMNLSSSNNYDLSNIQQYDFVVFANGSNANTPYAGGTFNSTNASYTTPAFTTTGKYWVRYRERHNCCGWSNPVYTSFDVIDTPNPPAAINIVGGPYCYDGTAKSFTITIPGSSFAYPGYDSWELFDVDPSFGTPTPIQTSTSALPSFGVTPTQTTTYYVRGKNACSTSSALSVMAVISADQSTNGVLATATSSKMCVVNDSLWHYFRNTSGQVIAAINSNGQNLGNVTMTVTIETVPHDGSYLSPRHGNGGIGNAKVCLGQPELSMRRWYTITPTTQPTAGNPSTIRLFFTSADYTNYATDITNWTSFIASNYDFCYGSTASALDLAVSKNELADIPIDNTSLTGGINGSTQYELTVPSFSTFRFHTNGGKGDPLPIELVSFTGWNQGEVNKLQWITASERNTAIYEVQKSISTGVWTAIGSVAAAGNSNVKLTYNYTDNIPVVGDNYYRLKIIDRDGTFSYSDMINIPITDVVSNDFTKVYPNPTGGLLNVEIQSTGLFDTYIDVFDILGSSVFSQTASLIKGQNKFKLDFSLLPKGTYLLRYADINGKLHITKFVKD